MTRADLTTWGRNIFPAPKRSPTTPMPSMSGPSMTLRGILYCSSASVVSSTMKVSIPRRSACSRRFSTVCLRHSRSSFWSFFLMPLNCSAKSNRRSVASGSRLSRTSSTCLSMSGLTSS